jgi:hypothetical protein
MASSPAGLGNIAYNLVGAVVPVNTATGMYFRRTSDTGAVTTTTRSLDLAATLTVGSTGGKPLDSTVHPRRGVPRWKSLAISIPLKLTYHTSGVNTYVTVTHKHRAATSGAGSTWDTIVAETYRYKMGTDTDAVFFTGLLSACNLQAVRRYYKTNIAFAWRKASSTSAKDTTTNQEAIVGPPTWLISGDTFGLSVAFKVS